MVNLMRDCSAVVPIPGVVVAISSRVCLRNTLSPGSHGELVFDESREGDPYMWAKPLITRDTTCGRATDRSVD